MRIGVLSIHAIALCLLSCGVALAQPNADANATRFEISYAPSVGAGPLTGRVFVILAAAVDREPRLQVGAWGSNTPPFFGSDVSGLRLGNTTVIDSGVLGFPVSNLKDVPAGDYVVQAVMSVYTEFHRSDGHTIWAHMDQWEGQHWNRSPGNLVSEPQHIHLDPSVGYDVKLSLTRVLPPVEVPADSTQVKHIKFQSALLSKFWGHPIYLGATVLLPKDYDQHPDVFYPVVYEQTHFGLKPPLEFNSDPSVQGRDATSEFAKRWNSPDFPRMIAVDWQHPTPYFDDSYAVNSPNNGPYGDAILQELIPYLETHFRMIRQPYARVLIGGSTGGWEALALQLYHPDFFGGTWTGYPAPIDFRRYVTADIYKDDSAFLAPGYTVPTVERPWMRTREGMTIVTMRQMSQLEAVLGSKGRSGQQLEAWEAAFGSTDAEGYPAALWDKRTGKIDHAVANAMKERGTDLREYTAENWSKIGPQLVGKLNFFCGDMDDYYLNLGVYLFELLLKQSKNPHYEGHFEYGRPMMGHGWWPKSNADLVVDMADHIVKNAPAGENISGWHYK